MVFFRCCCYYAGGSLSYKDGFFVVVHSTSFCKETNEFFSEIRRINQKPSQKWTETEILFLQVTIPLLEEVISSKAPDFVMALLENRIHHDNKVPLLSIQFEII